VTKKSAKENHKMSKLLRNFNTFDLIIISLLSACGIAIKPFVRTLTQVFTGSLIPAGAVSGIIYMIWIVLACSITKKRGTAILAGIVQSILVVAFDMLGNRGIANLLVYILPCIVMETVMLISPGYISSTAAGFFAGAVVNMTGDFIVSAVFMRLPLIPLLISLTMAAVSGGLGGVIAFKLYKSVAIINNQLKNGA